MSAQPASERAAIAAMGRVLGPDVLAAVQALYAHDLPRTPADLPDRRYGDHPRHLLDLYLPAGDGLRPIILWVHGGGFLRGDKGGAESPFNAHAGHWAARHRLVGAVMNYRLAPDAMWPAGGEDVGAAVSWLASNAASFGGDPGRIVAIGTSAGAVHVATHIHLAGARHGLAGAALLSGLYGQTPLDERDTLYYGAPALYADRMPREAIAATDLPLLVACSQYDPPRFQREFAGLLADRLERQGALPSAHVFAGHNHFSLAYHLGTADKRLEDALIDFIGGLA